MQITYTLIRRLEELATREPQRVQWVKRANVTKVNMEGNNVTGVTYALNNEKNEIVADGPVVLATGGYAADFGEDSILKRWAPDTFGLSTNNAAHATGDGHKMLMEIGARGIDLEMVRLPHLNIFTWSL